MSEERKKSNFSLAFRSLPRTQRNALDVLYSYCREIDDIVDETESTEAAQKGLQNWRNHFANIKNQNKPLPGLPGQVQSLIQDHGVLQEDLEWILTGCESDITKKRYQTFLELQDYCDAVASAVGLCIISILGEDRSRYYEYAMATGRALQLTNIIRDVENDLQRDRIYLPEEDRKRFFYSEKDLFEKKYNANFIDLMDFQAKRAEVFFQKSEKYLSNKEKQKLFAAEFMRKTYHRILQNIRNEQFEVFGHKIGLTRGQKLQLGWKAFWGQL